MSYSGYGRFLRILDGGDKLANEEFIGRNLECLNYYETIGF